MWGSPTVQKAYQSAKMTRAHAHAPYSNFNVGAAVQVKGVSESISGCNVENASFGGTVCAERVALFQAVARFGRISPEFIVVVTDEAAATVPCALCLQVMAEFCDDDMPIHLGNLQGLQKTLRLRDLLPHAFRSFKASAP